MILSYINAMVFCAMLSHFQTVYAMTNAYFQNSFARQSIKLK